MKNKRSNRISVGGDPAQITNCPCCDNILALPNQIKGNHTVGIIVESESTPEIDWQPRDDIDLIDFQSEKISNKNWTITLNLGFKEEIHFEEFDNLIDKALPACEVLSARASRPVILSITRINSQLIFKFFVQILNVL